MNSCLSGHGPPERIHMQAEPDTIRLRRLLSLVWDRIEAGDGPARRPNLQSGDHASARRNRGSNLQRFPVSRYLKPSLSAAARSGMGELAASLSESIDTLVWSQNETYLEAGLDSHFLDNYVTGMLTGMEANFACSVPCSGFVLLGPGAEYPEHSHAPREVYLVLTAGAHWRLDSGQWFAAKPGQVIYHSAWQRHAMRTHSEPMLAFAAWLDDGDRRAISIHN